MAGELAGDRSPELLGLVHDIAGMCAGAVGGGSSAAAASAIAGDGNFRKDCTDLVRRISLLTHLFEEIEELNKVVGSASSSSSEAAASASDGGAAAWSCDVVVALHSAKRLLSVARNFRSNCSSVSLSLSIYHWFFFFFVGFLEFEAVWFVAVLVNAVIDVEREVRREVI